MPVSIRTSRTALESGEAKLWVLLIGVNHYQDAQLPSLHYSALDCQALAEALAEATHAFPQRELWSHHDFAEKPPTLAIARHSLHHIITAAQPQDTVLVYFSGHGILDAPVEAAEATVETRAIAEPQAYLCLADTQRADLAQTGLAMAELLEHLGTCAARQQLIWLDACHSGGMTLLGNPSFQERQRNGHSKGADTPTDAPAEVPNPTPQLVALLRQRATQSKGFYALLSCDQAQQSWEFPELGHGVFTYFLMRGLRGEAADSQGLIEADGLYKYVYHQTLRYIDKTNQQLRLINQQKRSRGDGNVKPEYPLQTPKRIVEGIGELILGVHGGLAQADGVPQRAIAHAVSTPSLAHAGVQTHPIVSASGTLASPATASARSTLAPPSRQALIIEGVLTHSDTLTLGKLLRNLGGFEVQFRPQPGQEWAEVRAAIATCLHPAQGDQPLSTSLLYLRGHLVASEDGEAWLELGPTLRLSRSWLRQALRQATASQHILIIDCPRLDGSSRDKPSLDWPTPPALADWVEDLQLSDRGQCIIAAAAPPTGAADHFLHALVHTLETADATTGLSMAGWIAQLQIALAGTAIAPHIWLSGAQGVMEVLPGSVHPIDGLAGLDLGVCPYMGLRAFSEQDSHYFYGRETLTQKLMQTVGQTNVLAVIGASGSGKSSVVQAGVLAQLRQGKQIPGSDTWWLGRFRPGDKPVMALAQCLVDPGTAKERDYQQSQIEGFLYQGVDGFVQWLRRRPEPMVLLVIDQFEELFTLTVEAERRQFLELMLGAVDLAGDRFKLLFTLRTDFIAPCLEHPALAAILQQSSQLVPPALAPDAYRQVILRPAERVGLRVQPELVTVLLEELPQSASDLPLLEFVLEQLWQHRRHGELTLQAYQEEIGGLKQALERKAQDVYEQLDSTAQDCARWIFLSLTHLGNGTEDTRRRIPKSDLIVKKYPAPLVERTLQALTAAKLVTLVEDHTHGSSRSPDSNPDPQPDSDLNSNPESTPEAALPPVDWPLSPSADLLEVTHEILIRHWSTLRWWLDENRSRLRAQRQISEAAEQWQQHNRHPDFLLQGTRLAAAEDLYIQSVDELSQPVQEFIEACLDQRQQQQRQAQQQLRRTQRVAIALGSLGAIACGLAGVATWQQRTAQLREVEALAASSEAFLASNQQLDSVVTGLKAGRQLKQLRSFLGIPLPVPVATEMKTIGALQQALSRTQILNRLDGHTNQVNAVVFSAAGDRIATASDDKTVKLWQSSGQLLQTLTGHGDRVTDVSFSPNGQLLASTSADKTVRLWNADGRLRQTLSGHTDWTTQAQFNRQGTLLATASRDKTVKLWALPAQGAIRRGRTLTGAQGWVNAVAFSPNGQWLAGADESGRILLWPTKGPSPARTIATNSATAKERITALAFSPNGKIVAAASGDATVKLYSLNGGLIRTLRGHGDQVNAVQFSPDGQRLLSVGDDRTLRIWSLGGDLLQVWQAHTAAITGVRSNPTGTVIATASADKTVALWSSQNFFQPYGGGAYTARFSPDNRFFAAAGWDATVQLWPRSPTPPKAPQYTFRGHSAPISTLDFNQASTLIATASADKTVRLWSWPQGTVKTTLVNPSGRISTLDFNPSGTVLVTGGVDKSIKLWNLPDGTLKRSLEGHTDSISTVQFSPDGQHIASAGYDDTIRLWQADGIPIAVLGKHSLAVADLRFSPDGQLLASASWDNTIKLWHRHTRQVRHTLQGHTDAVTSVAFSPDGRVLASSSVDRTLRLWDARTGTLLKTLLGYADPMQSLQFSADGKGIISASEKAGVLLWNLDLESLLAQGGDRFQNYWLTHPEL
jgi:WD40 repeat protein/uncharacterized caspase-like protein